MESQHDRSWMVLVAVVVVIPVLVIGLMVYLFMLKMEESQIPNPVPSVSSVCG